MFKDTQNGQTNYDPADIEYRGAFEWDIELAGTDSGQNVLMAISRAIRNKKLPEMKYYIQTNQNRDKLYYYACTIHSTFGCIADMFTLTRESYETYIAEIVQYMIEKWWYDPEWGAYTINSAKACEYIWNKHNPDRKVVLITTEIGSGIFTTLSSFWYSFAMTYISWDEYYIDALDGTLDNTHFSKSKWGHSIRWKNLWILGKWVVSQVYTALDNYFTKDKKDYKRYIIDRSKVIPLRSDMEREGKKGNYFPRCYTFLPADLF